MTKVEFTKIVKLLSYNGFDMSKDGEKLRDDFENERHQFFSTRPDPQNLTNIECIYDLDSHIRWIKYTAEEFGMNEHIFFEDNPKDFLIKRDEGKFPAKFARKKIIVKGLTILCGQEKRDIFHLEGLPSFFWPDIRE